MTSLQFPADFLWGAATASYQIEGAADADGRGESIWDRLCKRPGAIANGDTGAVACNHYELWESDLDLIKELGLRAYRFSIAWPRIFPTGAGALEPRGLDFYSRLVDGLLERGIEPWPTLYHWDLPQALEDQGGWRARATAERFAEYAAVVAERLGDRVKNWMTLNEPWCSIELGYRMGVHAPGAKEPEKVVRQVTHNLLLAHGLAVRAIREKTPQPVRVGLVLNPSVAEPFTEEAADVATARTEFERSNAWLMDPVCKGRYPAAEWEKLGANVPEVQDGDLEAMNEPLDFLGLNIYTCFAGVARAGCNLHPYEKHYPRTAMDWPIVPDCLYWATRFTQEVYAPPATYITESGCAFDDAVNNRGAVEDYARVNYLKAHLRGVKRAVDEGLPLKGYFAWSLMDNFEWAFGYDRRFGLVHVDYETQKRTPKASAEWYSRLIAGQPKSS